MSTSDWHPKGFEAYVKSSYTFEDAELLARMWNIPVSEAKQAIGHKIINGIENLLPTKVAPDPKFGDDTSGWHPKGLEAYFNSRYDFADAELLAQMWNITTEEAKQAIGHKIIHGIEDLLPPKVAPEPKVTEPDWDTKALDAFFQSDYTYNDAERLARLWGQSGAVEGKKLIGGKILNGQGKLIPFLLKSAPDPKSNPNSGTPSDSGNKLLDGFFDSTYTFEDAELLSQLWNIDIVEAKKTIGFKVLNNAESALPDKLRRDTRPGQLLDAFFDSDYTYDDADILSGLWNINIAEAKKTIGYKVVSGWEEALPAKIRRAVG